MIRFILVFTLALAACAGPAERAATGASAQAGETACTRNCNRAYAVCTESSAAGRSLGPFSGSESCARELRQCLALCRAPQ